jgi:DNA-binding transcriptional ArsR family regulator
MLESLFGNRTAERVLLYLENYEEGYARQIASIFGASLNAVQKQLRRFEDGGVLVSRTVGRTRVFTWNPRYPFKAPLRQLLSAALEHLPQSEIRAYYRQRRRPRRSGKPT